jgi:PKD repeat protein
VDKQDNITDGAFNGQGHLPFTVFFEALKKNGFSVTLTQISQANSLIIQYANQVKCETELCNYLSPVFASNEDEQVLFKRLFEKFFKIQGPAIPKKPPFKPPSKWKWYIAGYGLLIVLLLAGLLMYQRNVLGSCPDVLPDQLKIGLNETVQPGIEKDANFFIQKHTSEKFTLVPGITTSKEISQKINEGVIVVKTNYNWGDSTNDDTASTHSYTKPGKYSVALNTSVYCGRNGSLIKKKTTYATVAVCSENNTLNIKAPKKIDSVDIEQKIELEAITGNSNKGETIYWYLNDSAVKGSDKKIAITFDKTGTYTITCKVIFDSINSPCTLTKSIKITVPAIVENEKGTFAPPDVPLPGGDSEPHEPYNRLLKPLYYTTISLFFILAIIFIALWNKERKNAARVKRNMENKYRQFNTVEKKESKPRQMPFRNVNYMPIYEPDIKQISLQMRRRVSDTISFLNINKSIKRTVESGGLFQPVHDLRTRQTEYLFLVHRHSENSQFAKLIDYLALMLKKSNVLIEKFYYADDIMKCYHHDYPDGVSLEKLGKNHSNHILLIFGNGYELIYPYYPVIQKNHLDTINAWQYKAIITPVSFVDWSVNEKDVLMPAIPVFPADIPGMAVLFEMLSTKMGSIDVMIKLRQFKTLFYSSEGFDFEDITALEHYCNAATWACRTENGEPVNVLLQWLAAMAVYPKLQWELMLVLGKVIFDKYNIPHELNFSCLLRIVRIDWVDKSIFPDKLRLELLKKLELENELLARKTILQQLKDIPDNVLKGNPVLNEEKQIQQVINEFSLYANDPVLYSEHIESEPLFEALWAQAKIRDSPLKVYLKNETGKWSTPLSKADNKTGIVKNVTIAEYFESQKEEQGIIAKFYLYCALLSIAGFAFSLFALLILWRQWDNG